MKVKILSDSNIKKLEFRVNEFIKDKSIVNISHEISVVKKNKRYINILVIVILYHENDYSGYLDMNSLKK